MMSDFVQKGPIATLHLFGARGRDEIEEQIEQAARDRPIALILPCLVTEMEGPALKGILEALNQVSYLREIVVTLGPASTEEFRNACEFFKPLEKEGRRVRIVWNDGERIRALYQEMEMARLSAGPHGKGRSAWMASGYIVARGESYVIALHDCDILSYTRDMLNRLVYPTVMPTLDYQFCKGYYSRITDRMHGRVTRLLVAPLIYSLTKILGHLPILVYFGSFRYPPSGEFSMVADLARVNRIPADWGLEVGVLAEIFRNCSLNRVCQVELCENYEHKHQALSPEDPHKGLHRMAIDICTAIFWILYSSGVVLSRGAFNTLRATFLLEAQDLMTMYEHDALINCLIYDRHSEATAIEMFAEAIGSAAEIIGKDPLGRPLIPNWSRIFSAIPDFAEKLVAAVDEDNEGKFQ